MNKQLSPELAELLSDISDPGELYAAQLIVAQCQAVEPDPAAEHRAYIQSLLQPIAIKYYADTSYLRADPPQQVY